jgi:hypothetical protein
MTAWKIAGNEAIRIAERDGVTLHKYSDPIDGYRTVTVNEARQIAREDSSLIYCVVEPTGWTIPANFAVAGYNVDDYFRGATYLGPDEAGVEPTWADVKLA